jgi:hypothetical protein
MISSNSCEGSVMMVQKFLDVRLRTAGRASPSFMPKLLPSRTFILEGDEGWWRS